MLKTALLLLLSFAATSGFAQTQKKKTLEEKLVDKNKEISEKIDQAAKDLDYALAGKRTLDDINRTSLILRNQLNWAEGGIFTYSPHVDLHLVLPNVEKQLRLRFSTYDDDRENRGINKNRLKTGPRRENYQGGARLLQKLGEINTEFQPRIDFRSGFQNSYILKLYSTAQWGALSLLPEAQFFAKSDSGVGQFTAFNINVVIYHSLNFTLINEEEYVDRENTLSTNNGFRISHDYNDVMSQTYSLMFESISRPTFHLARYTASLGLSHKFYKNILHYTLTPYLVFERNMNFRGSPGVIFELNIIF